MICCTYNYIRISGLFHFNTIAAAIGRIIKQRFAGARNRRQGRRIRM